MTGLPASLRLPRKPAGTASQGFGATSRIDDWATEPGIVAFGFTAFIVYSLFSALLWYPLFGVAYEVDGYLSPFFSPLIHPDWMPTWFSPAILILWIPLGFRTTCYYYRKAYYRSYFADPPACAVGEPTVHKKYRMETAFPFILQNLHRLFLYLAFVPLFFLWLDALLSLFSLSCNSLRHLVGGRFDCFSCTRRRRVQHSVWQRITTLNLNHMGWAWVSFFSVVLADLYIRLLALGVITDPAIYF